MRSNRQVYLTAFKDESPGSGPALTASAFVPDLHHYKGSFGGRVFPLWADAAATLPNIAASVLARVAERLGADIAAEDLFAYLVVVAAHPGYVERFRADLTQPGLRIPVTADPELFAEAAALGRRVVWLQTFGERMADAGAGRLPGPPRLPTGRRPQVPVGGAIPDTPEGFPDLLGYDASSERLLVGSGFIAPVPPAVWRYEVSGMQVLPQWFSYRKKDRSRPMIGDRRQPSPLGLIQPDTWPAEYTTELLNVLNVLGLLVDMEPAQAGLLQRICAGPLLDAAALGLRGLPVADPLAGKRAGQALDQHELF